MGRLTTHILDLANGRPAAGVTVELFRLEPAPMCVASVVTDDDGRCPRPLLEGKDMIPGAYELSFHAGAYFRDMGMDLPNPAFLERPVVRFTLLSQNDHLHVPLLLSPFGYSTYRGS